MNNLFEKIENNIHFNFDEYCTISSNEVKKLLYRIKSIISSDVKFRYFLYDKNLVLFHRLNDINDIYIISIHLNEYVAAVMVDRDEYYYTRISKYHFLQTSYKCDQIDGVISCISNLIDNDIRSI